MEKTARNRSVQLTPSQQLFPEPWWSDAHCFLPLVLGPLAFLVTVMPAVHAVLEGAQMEFSTLFFRGVIRLILFSGLGFILGLLIHSGLRSTLLSKPKGLDVVVDDDTVVQKKEAPIPVALRISVDQLEPGMRLAEALRNADGSQLAPSGSLVSEPLLAKIRQSNMSEVQIEGLKYPVAPEVEAAGTTK